MTNHLSPSEGVTIKWAPAGERIRKIVRRSNFRPTGKYPSFRNRRSVHWESFIERDCFKRLDADQFVTEFSEQPAELTYSYRGQSLVHFPDLIVNRGGRRIFVEVKSWDDPDLEGAVQRGEILKPLLLRHGYSYRVLTDIDIRSEPHFSNARRLLQYGRAPVDFRSRETLRRHFVAHRLVTWRQLLSGRLGPYGPQQVARLILDGLLTFDTSHPLSAAPEISLSYKHTAKESKSWL